MRGQILEFPIEMAGHPYNSAAQPVMLNVWRWSSLDLAKASIPVQVWREFGKATTLLSRQEWGYWKH